MTPEELSLIGITTQGVSDAFFWAFELVIGSYLLGYIIAVIQTAISKA